MVEAAGAELDRSGHANQLMVCGLHGSQVDRTPFTTVWLVLWSAPESSGVRPSLGDILETAKQHIQATNPYCSRRAPGWLHLEGPFMDSLEPPVRSPRSESIRIKSVWR